MSKKKKKLPIEEELTSSAQEATPLPMIFGTVKVAVQWIGRADLKRKKAAASRSAKK